MQSLPCQHVSRQIRLLLDKFPCVFWTLLHLETYNLLHDHQLSFPQISKDLRVRMCPLVLYGLQLFSDHVFDRIDLSGFVQ